MKAKTTKKTSTKKTATPKPSKRFNPRNYYGDEANDKKDLIHKVKLPKSIGRLYQCSDKQCKLFFVEKIRVVSASWTKERFYFQPSESWMRNSICPVCRAKAAKTDTETKIRVLQNRLVNTDKRIIKQIEEASKLVNNLVEFYTKEGILK